MTLRQPTADETDGFYSSLKPEWKINLPQKPEETVNHEDQWI